MCMAWLSFIAAKQGIHGYTFMWPNPRDHIKACQERWQLHRHLRLNIIQASIDVLVMKCLNTIPPSSNLGSCMKHLACVNESCGLNKYNMN